MHEISVRCGDATTHALDEFEQEKKVFSILFGSPSPNLLRGVNFNSHIYMERLQSDLTTLINTNQEINIKFLTDDLINGMGHLARFGFFHRDIKPSNVLVDSQGTFKLADFGLSESIQNMTRKVQGTPLYMIPSDIEIVTPFGLASDRYAVLVTLYNVVKKTRSPVTIPRGDLSKAMKSEDCKTTFKAFLKREDWENNTVKRYRDVFVLPCFTNL